MIVVTKADRAPDLVVATIERARSELAHTGLRDAPAVAVSAVQSNGLDRLRQVLDDVLAETPAPDASGRLHPQRTSSISSSRMPASISTMVTVRLPRVRTDLGRAEAGVAELEARLLANPFLAPKVGELAALGLGVRELAAAERVRRVLRLQGGVVLLPSAPVLAIWALAQLPQPFTTSQARQALGTSRRVAIPLLEHLDGRGWTRRIDDEHREVVR